MEQNAKSILTFAGKVNLAPGSSTTSNSQKTTKKIEREMNMKEVIAEVRYSKAYQRSYKKKQIGLNLR